ncbi:MAG TPA: DUF4215 domain-containing protein [Rudaea sp.]|nr:DUF4215 domain-containing protein [Rudaea sp.]
MSGGAVGHGRGARTGSLLQLTLGAGQPTICGDGIVVAGIEQCDDGGTVDSDGCSDTCSVEPGYTCIGSPSVCTQNP